MSQNKNATPNKKDPEDPIIEEEEGEFDSIEGKIHEDQETSNMDEKEDIRSIFNGLNKVLIDISHNFIRSRKEIKEYIARIPNGGGSSNGFHHEERRAYGQTIFSKNGLQNQPLEFTIYSWPTIPKFI